MMILGQICETSLNLFVVVSNITKNHNFVYLSFLLPVVFACFCPIFTIIHQVHKISVGTLCPLMAIQLN